jgi:Ca2+-binding EF-hand superfamily protein
VFIYFWYYAAEMVGCSIVSHPLCTSRILSSPRVLTLCLFVCFQAQKKRYITDEELQTMQKLYQKCDENGDGNVSVAELEKAFAQIQDPKLKAIAQHAVPDLDRDGNGNVR